MIIGINGYISSGKDTIGKIIQDSDGCWAARDDMGAGMKWYKGDKNWQIKKFAAKLKQIASILTGIPQEKFEDQEFKKTLLPKEWNSKLPIFSTGDLDKVDKEWPITVREFLQRLGTEAIRNNIHENAWVNALFANYNPRYEDHGKEIREEFIYPNWIITDTRFPNEAQAIKERGGIVIRINRYYEFGEGEKKVQPFQIKDLHPSETSLDSWNFDYVIENNGTIEELTGKVKEMLEHFKLL